MQEQSGMSDASPCSFVNSKRLALSQVWSREVNQYRLMR
jgi:hypothetical protein